MATEEGQTIATDASEKEMKDPRFEAIPRLNQEDRGVS